jgi:bacterioferritin-associated ferredoxin
MCVRTARMSACWSRHSSPDRNISIGSSRCSRAENRHWPAHGRDACSAACSHLACVRLIPWVGQLDHIRLNPKSAFACCPARLVRPTTAYPAANTHTHMIICSCNVLTDSDVRAVLTTAEATPRTPRQVYGCLGCSAECGRCARTIRRIINEALSGPSASAASCACLERSVG